MNKKEKVEHPENGIRLIDGRIIEAYPLKEETPTVDNALTLDTTGEYLVLSRERKPQVLNNEEMREDRRRREAEFYSNAWLFLAKADRILSDSRIFLTPVPVVSGLAYTGTGGFRHPTLGIYVEWWKHHFEESHTKKGLPLWYLAGSPLSGANRCACVSKDGKSTSLYISHFSRAWRSFVSVNTRYDEVKTKYQAYTLRQAIKVLTDSEDVYVNQYIDRILADNQKLEEEKMRLREVVYNKDIELFKAHNREIELIVRLDYEAVKGFIEEYHRLHLEHSRSKTAYYRKKNELRKSRQEIGMSYEQYTARLPEMHAEVEQALVARDSFAHQFIEKFKQAHGISSITLEEIQTTYQKLKQTT